MQELNSKECPACKRRKRLLHSFCRRCYGALPLDIQAGLYLSFAAGYMPYYRKAKEILRET
jgi:hypothetical protein